MYLCLKAAISKGLENASIRDVLIAPIKDNNDLENKKEKTYALTSGLREYQDSMRSMAVYNVNLFEYDPPLETSDIAQRMKDALEPIPQISLGKE